MYAEQYTSKLPANERLYVIAVISNPWRYHSRYYLYEKFANMVRASGAQLFTVECAYGQREHTIPVTDPRWHLRLQTNHELWHKENMINLAIQRLPDDWRYVAWIDADVQFARDDWAKETLQLLQHYQLVQMWGECMDLTPDHEPFQRHVSFMKCYQDTIHGRMADSRYSTESSEVCYAQESVQGVYWHPGFAWAARREAINALGGLIDWSVLGANDHHMANALVGRLDLSVHGRCSPAFRTSMDEWQARAQLHIKRNIGYMPGLIMHNWHGRKRDRKYRDRWAVLVKAQYDPTLDIKRDWQGLYQLTERSTQLRDGIREYLRTRNEDSIDIDEGERTIGGLMIVKKPR